MLRSAIAFDSRGPVPPGPPGMEAVGPQGAGTAANPAHLQQMMLRQRHLVIEKQRTAARTRLGAGVIAQANPLAAASMPLKMAGWNALLGEGPTPTVADQLRPAASALTMVGSLTTTPKGKEVPTNEKTSGATQTTTSAAAVGKKIAFDDLQEDIAEEILTDEPAQAQPLSEYQSEATEPNAGRPYANGREQAKQLQPQRVDEHVGMKDPSDGTSMAWGGHAGARMPFLVDTEEVIDDLDPMPDARPSRAAAGPSSRRRLIEDRLDDVATPLRDTGLGKRPPGPSWNLHVGGTQEFETKRGGGERKWWKPWQQGAAASVAEQAEVTRVCGFTND